MAFPEKLNFIQRVRKLEIVLTVSLVQKVGLEIEVDWVLAGCSNKSRHSITNGSNGLYINTETKST